MHTLSPDLLSQIADAGLLPGACRIGHAWVGAHHDARLIVDNPATGEAIASVPNLGAPETRLAIESAAAALPAWRSRPARERSAILRRWFDLVVAHQTDLATLMTLEQGKPLAEAKGEVIYGASFLEWFAEEAKRVYGDTIPSFARDRRLMVLKQPVGVVGCITPWNFPVAMVTRKVAPALAVGCTVVLKPAEQTPLSALALAVLAERAGVPSGVFNVITGAPEAIGGELTSHPVVRKLSFTGSTEVGRLLMAQCAGTIKKLSLELGGNAPFIVFDDADIDAAVEGAVAAKFRNSGQTCVCPNRFYVQAGVYDAFVNRLSAAVDRLVVGPGLEPGVTQGPLIDDAALAKVDRLVADAVHQGARTRPHAATRRGRFYPPTVLTGVTAAMDVAREEVFGPVAAVFQFDSEADVIAHANDTHYGLAAYFYGRDIGRVWRVAEALEFGIVAVNTGAFSTEVAPFGGMKQSGVGREGSRYGIDDFLEVKYVCMGGV